MKNITTLSSVFEKVENLSKSCTDTLIPVEDIKFNSLYTVNIAGEPHSVQPIAQREFAVRLGIPIQYLRKCPPEVQAYNMNHWIEKERNEKLLFRFDGGDVRAVFTPKYRPVDNFEVLERLDNLGFGPDTEVQCSLDAQFMSLSILEGKQAFEINGEKMVPGISVSNSEVGLSSLSIAAFFLRLVCTNGMIAKTAVSTSFRHVSLKILREFPSVIEDVSRKALHQKEAFKHSMESPVNNPESTIDSFNRQFQLSSAEKEAVTWALPFEYGKTMFNIVNTYTKASQYEKLSAESSYKLQKTGGAILAMLR